MARRRKKDDVAGIAAQLVGLAMMIGLISPQGRQLMSGLGFLALLLLILGGFGVVTFVFYRIATRSKRLQIASAGLSPAGHAISIPPITVTARSAASFSPEVHGGAAIVKSPGLAADLIEQLRAIDWFQFEKIVALAYRKQGYSVTRRGGANPDGGIDLTISKDGETKAVQCKQWKSWNVGVKSVREFLGALTDAGIQKGIFITLQGYTSEAKQLADKHGIEIVSETDLTAMLAATDEGVQEILRDPRKFCPKCEREMVLRTARKGLVAGNQFWGCSAYPRCRFTLPIIS